MRKIERLRIEALENCKLKEHNMKPFNRKYRHWWSSECRVCGGIVNVDDNPLPNGYNIEGEAVTLYCPKFLRRWLNEK